MTPLGQHQRHLLSSVLLSFVICLIPDSALADNKTAARAAASVGIQDYEAGRYVEALKRLEKAEQLQHAPPHLLYLARTQAKLNQLVAARETYLSLIHETLLKSAPEAFFTAQETARAEVAELEQRIPHITVTISGGEDGDLVLNGVNMGSGLTGVPYPVDPGQHTVRVVTPAAESALLNLILREGEQMPVSLHLVPKSEETTTPLPQHREEQGADPSGSSPTERTETKKSALKSTLTYGGFGLAAVGIGVGSVTGILAIQKVDSVKEEYECDRSGICNNATSAEASEALKAGRTMELLSTVGFAAGAVGVGLGIWGLLMDGDESSQGGSRNSKFVPLVGQTNGVSWIGVF